MVDTTKRFNARAFWSLLAGLTLLGLPWTGLELHLHQVDPMTAERHAWMAAHWVLATLLAVAAVAHAILNVRALARYARGLAGRLLPVSREALAALALTGALLTLGVGHAGLAGDRGAGRARLAQAATGGDRAAP